MPQVGYLKHRSFQCGVLRQGGGTREIFYYPKGTQAISIVGEDINRGLLEQGGIQVGKDSVVSTSAQQTTLFKLSHLKLPTRHPGHNPYSATTETVTHVSTASVSRLQAIVCMSLVSQFEFLMCIVFPG